MLDVSTWRKFKCIIVVGPNRTGTTFFSKYISDSLNYQLVDEEIHRYSDSIFNFLLNSRKKRVFQAPGYMCASHHFSDDETLIVVMKRDLDEIIASSLRIRGNLSEDRINSGFEKVLSRYRRFVPNYLLDLYIPSPVVLGSSAVFRYAVWENYGKKHTKNFVEIDYSDLCSLDTFVSKQARQKFSAKQVNVKSDGVMQAMCTRLVNAINFRVLAVIAFLFEKLCAGGKRLK